MIKSYIIAMTLAFFLISILNFFLNKSNKELKNKIMWQHYLFGYLFILYLMIALKDVVGFPCLSEWKRLFNLNESIFNPNLNLIPFVDGVEISGVLNIIFFMPFGFLLPTLWSKYRKILPTLFYGLTFSIIIEFAQLFTNGRGTDVNDLIMNTIGTVLGWILFKILRNIFSKLSSKTVVENSCDDKIIIKSESYLYVAIAIISTFAS